PIVRHQRLHCYCAYLYWWISRILASHYIAIGQVIKL
ncbi:MAG: hypothetical protein ACI9VI_001567, partial [Candidatus Azotimanducaceae bacterium]